MARVTSELFPKNLRVIRAVGLHQLIAGMKGLDTDAVEGAVEPPYELPNIRVEYARQEPPGIPTAFWRGVGPTHSVFVVESFIDELAAAAGQDPLAYRRGVVRRPPPAEGGGAPGGPKGGGGEPPPARRGGGGGGLVALRGCPGPGAGGGLLA